MNAGKWRGGEWMDAHHGRARLHLHEHVPCLSTAHYHHHHPTPPITASRAHTCPSFLHAAAPSD
eukprot:82518-Chlamydomonas_euryale.AAC.1